MKIYEDMSVYESQICLSTLVPILVADKKLNWQNYAFHLNVMRDGLVKWLHFSRRTLRLFLYLTISWKQEVIHQILHIAFWYLMNSIGEFFNFFVYFPLHFISISTKIYGHVKNYEWVINSTNIKICKDRNK